jgi:formate hydrogenlyase subunit 4
MHGCSLLEGQSFISGFYDVAKVAIIEKIIPLNNGYILEMKEGFKKHRVLLYSWPPSGSFHKTLARFGIFLTRNLANLGHFLFQSKIFSVGQNHIFQVEIWRKISSKRTTADFIFLIIIIIGSQICFNHLRDESAPWVYYKIEKKKQ